MPYNMPTWIAEIGASCYNVHFVFQNIPLKTFADDVDSEAQNCMKRRIAQCCKKIFFRISWKIKNKSNFETPPNMLNTLFLPASHFQFIYYTTRLNSLNQLVFLMQRKVSNLYFHLSAALKTYYPVTQHQNPSVIFVKNRWNNIYHEELIAARQKYSLNSLLKVVLAVTDNKNETFCKLKSNL